VTYVLGPVRGGTRLTREMTVEFADGHQECAAFRRRIADTAVQQRFLTNVKTALERQSVVTV
jgi:hypothetical protein